MKRFTTLGIVLTLLIVGTQAVLAEGYPWKDHAAPFDFFFENHFDTHQQSKVNGELLRGHFYIRFTGDAQDGYPVAKHANCSEVPDECTVGWKLHGIPMVAELVAHGEGEHPTWCIDADDLPTQPGYTHFHWAGSPEHAGGLIEGEVYEGYLLKLTARDSFYFEHHGGFFVDPGIDYETHSNIVTDCE